jgi:Bacteriophage probable baseplate hub protein
MATSSALEPGLPTEYYAPDFLVEIEGQELDQESKADVLELKVVMDMENMTSCQLSVNNWDDRSFDLKYSDKATFDVGNRVHIQLGYAGELRSMMRGQISTLAPRFPESGQPSIDVSVLDGMLKLRDRKPAEGETKKYVDKADWQIAKTIAQRNGMRPVVTEDGETHKEVVQKNQDDASFLMERAKRIDFDCFVLTDPDSGQDTLNFVRPTDARDSSATRVYEFVWGESLISFTPVLTLSRQVAKVTVKGWDPRTKEAISFTASTSDLPGSSGGGTSGPKVAEDTLGAKEEVVVDAPIQSEQEARELAVSLLRERAYEFITGTGRAIGIPDLRPGDNTKLKRLGKRFSGEYYVTKVEHTLSNAGYFTDFDVRSVYDGGLE